ncbi:DNA-directed DNA/RNA polymerase mu-like [Penaeus monodon]|uniref:DNA-directed DNA/RNA polymerase mu-like n=1 Tax=Penaeus monodon TaxID=6687 RepID=UPI0018A7293C|nr:DNA-directed DNA/RNA polymerase mu-like [Penaeus monodon]
MSCESQKRKHEEMEPVLDSVGEKPEAVLFLVQEGIQGKRFQLMKNFAAKNGFHCEDQLCERVTHVLSELDNVKQIKKLYPQLSQNSHIKIVSSQWMYASVRQKMHVPENNFLLEGYHQWLVESLQDAPSSSKRNELGLQSESVGSKQKLAKDNGEMGHTEHYKKTFNENILERNAKLQNHNMKLVESLTFMNNYWTVMGDERRALAYAKAAATVKCLPFTVMTIEQIEELKGLGTGHCLKVVQEVLRTGTCREVTTKAESEKYIGLKNLTSVYGIGAGLAEKLYTVHNLRTVQDLITHWNHLKLADERIKYGVAYHQDLSTPVTREDARKIESILKEQLDVIKPGYTLEITGGFRRGKKTGHDVDFLISYKKDGEEVGVLSKLLLSLTNQGHIIHQKVEKSTFDEEAVFKKASEKVNPMDHFEKCFCIFRLPVCEPWTSSDTLNMGKDFESLLKEGESKRDWKAVRVDFVFVPSSQWGYALLGWTGSKLYMRLLRHYSNHYLNMLLNSHGLWNRADNTLLPAKNEEEVFQNLGLSYKEPCDRNF